MSAKVSVAIVVPVARKSAVEAAIAVLTPRYTARLTVPVCALDANATWQTPPTHWYTNGASVDLAIAAAWQSVADGTLPEGFEIPPESAMAEADILNALVGIPVWTGANVADANAWADANLTPEGLMRVPPNPNI